MLMSKEKLLALINNFNDEVVFNVSQDIEYPVDRHALIPFGSAQYQIQMSHQEIAGHLTIEYRCVHMSRES